MKVGRGLGKGERLKLQWLYLNDGAGEKRAVDVGRTPAGRNVSRGGREGEGRRVAMCLPCTLYSLECVGDGAKEGKKTYFIPDV